MKAIILAGGKGSRLRPLTNTQPKPLVKVLGKPLIEYALETLTSLVDELIILIGYKGELVKEYFGSNYRGIPITYVDQGKWLGTGHALIQCKEHIDGDFMLLHADEIFDEDSIVELAKHDAAALAFKRDDPQHFGVMVYDKHMNLEDLDEKPEHPRSNLVSAGAFKLTPEIFNHYPPPEKNGEYYLADMIPSYLTKQPMKVVEAKRWLTVNRPEDIQTAEDILRQENAVG